MPASGQAASGGRRRLRRAGLRTTPTPAAEQAAELSRTFGCVRLVYNKALEERTRAWYSEQRRVSYVQSSAALTEWKKTGELAFLTEVSSVPLQQALRHLQTAFAHFFAKRAKYPRFKSRKKSRASAEYTRSAFKFRDGQLTLAKMAEPLDIRWSRPLPHGCAWYGRELVVIDRWFPSSKLCGACGTVAARLPLNVRAWTCEHCGAVHDRDVNAARNILAAGLAASAWGDGVRPQRESSRTGRSSVKQEPQRASGARKGPGSPRLIRGAGHSLSRSRR
ncbi:RNA-guided endonuclease InsQ/TnpB family protein [Streptomyces sp. NBC_00425]|uniref:RNA-guided endonuclease InsQ/TnpB family protein n=1 Tax=Streptomyces sp. NBC_00425 TaxID=2975740 RepID=UPI002E1E9212